MGAFEGSSYATFVPKESGAYWLVSKCQGNVSVGIGWSHSVKHTDLTKPTLLKQIVFLTAGRPYQVQARFQHQSGDMHIAFGFVRAKTPFEDPEALRKLEAADKVIVGVGFNPYLESEGTDRPFELPPDQQALVEGLIKMKKRIILVVNSGAGVDLAPYADGVDAIIQAWYPGQEGAAALADIITGKVNPSGKLATSFPKTLAGTYYADAYPPKGGHLAYSEDLLIGYRWFDTLQKEPLYPFGFGLSYTAFAVSGVVAKVDNGSLTVKATVKNTGRRPGADVVQAYVGLQTPTDGYPLKELKAFKRVSLSAGRGSRVTLQIPLRDLAHWDTPSHMWRVAKGDYLAYVGDSSRNVTAVSFKVDQDQTFGP